MKRLAAILIMLLLLLPALPAAAESPTVVEVAGESYAGFGAWDNDAMLTGYVGELFGLNGFRSRVDKPMGGQLTGMNKVFYNLLREQIALVASGERASTKFEFDVEALLPDQPWSAADLGVSSIVENNSISEAATNAAMDKLSFNLNLVMDALHADCPYELYWYDGTGGWQPGGSYRFGTAYSDGECRLTMTGTYTFPMPVAQDYAGDADCTVESGGASRAVAAAANARAIVSQHGDEDDVDKLYSYRADIRGLTDYNHAAADDDETPYGDPNTKVVCEGYSKAFQYLCDNTYFDRRISCYCATGYLYGENDTEGGQHMWNIVSMPDGQNYLVDVTNSIEDSEGRIYLFLNGWTAHPADVQYNFAQGSSEVAYVYDSDLYDLYDAEDLVLSGADFDRASLPELNPHLSVSMAIVDPQEVYRLGDTVEIAVTVTNDGNTVQHDPSGYFVVDPFNYPNGQEPEWKPHFAENLPNQDLLPNEQVSVVLTHEITVDDILYAEVYEYGCRPYINLFDDNGWISGDPIPVEPVNIQLSASISFDGDYYGSANPMPGDTIAYTLHIENTGNVGFSNRTYADSLSGQTGSFTDSYYLEPGEAEEMTFQYVITEADAHAGQIDTVVTVTAQDPKDYENTLSWTVSFPAPILIPEYAVENGVLVGWYGDAVDVVIPDDLGITAIGAAFENRTDIESIVVPNGVTEIQPRAFAGCTGLRTLALPAAITEIAPTAVEGCDARLIVCGYSDSCARAFAQESRLTFRCLDDFELPAAEIVLNGVKIIEESAFEGDTFQSVRLIGTETIGLRAFAGCEYLTQVEIPASVTDIATDAFDGCDLITIYCPETCAAREFAIAHRIPCVLTD